MHMHIYNTYNVHNDRHNNITEHKIKVHTSAYQNIRHTFILILLAMFDNGHRLSDLQSSLLDIRLI